MLFIIVSKMMWKNVCCKNIFVNRAEQTGPNRVSGFWALLPFSYALIGAASSTFMPKRSVHKYDLQYNSERETLHLIHVGVGVPPVRGSASARV